MRSKCEGDELRGCMGASAHRCMSVRVHASVSAWVHGRECVIGSGFRCLCASQGLMQLGADWEKHRRPLINKLRSLKVRALIHCPHCTMDRSPNLTFAVMQRTLTTPCNARALQESIAQRKAACKHKVGAHL